MQTHQDKIRDGFTEALENVLSGLMEGGSLLKLILCIFRNCCANERSDISVFQKVEFLYGCGGLPGQIPDVTNKMLVGASKFTESWFMSCFIDLIDLFTLSLSLLVVPSPGIKDSSDIPLIDVRQCFKSFLGCLKFPNNKQQKLRLSTMKAIHALVHTSNKLSAPELPIDKDSFFEFLSLKVLAKLRPIQSTIYTIIARTLLRQSRHNKELSAADFVQYLMHGAGKALLETIINDINQHQNLESVLLLVNAAMPSEILMAYLTKKITNMSTLLTNANDDASKEQVLRFLLYTRSSLSSIKTESGYVY